MIVLVSWVGNCQYPEPEIMRLVCQGLQGLISKDLRTPKRARVRGDSRRCWQTVEKAAKKQGGKLLPGWSLVEQDPRLPQTNPLARMVLNAHCVLEKDGQWYETIPERYGAKGFIPGPVPTNNACVEFFDDEASLERAELPAWNFECMPYTYFSFQVDEIVLPP
jgi:hypothetical protein